MIARGKNETCNVSLILVSKPYSPTSPAFSTFYSKLSEKAMAPHSSTLAWEIPWTEEPGRLQSMGSLGVGQDWGLHFHFSLSCTGEGNGNPLQCSCLENPRDGRAWWTAMYGVAQSRTRLTWLSSSSSTASCMASTDSGLRKQTLLQNAKRSRDTMHTLQKHLQEGRNICSHVCNQPVRPTQIWIQ